MAHLRRPPARRSLVRPQTLLLLIGLAGIGCASSGSQQPTPTGDSTMSYLDTWRRLAAAGRPFERGSESERRALDGVRSLLADFKAPDFEARARALYSPDAHFDDTLKTVFGSEAIARYLAKSGRALDSGTVEFFDVAESNGDYYLRWEMSLRFRELKRGETLRSIGMTHLRFDRDGRVVLHQDFWDSTSGLFEHLPVLGWMIKRVKANL